MKNIPVPKLSSWIQYLRPFHSGKPLKYQNIRCKSDHGVEIFIGSQYQTGSMVYRTSQETVPI